ncbi:hypothetical protein CEUSTIGMA_g9624.t1 [Chlamydomonas eustigma]|uniref:Uncharacterized protein n=1 Tax=Chlamydomonas eustigma TaxID=1157962 RepID=A0A250XGP3_9CHLO|nr:hypothetical protein CEUSTIGMA_g9624.t1 [Chlamydomonas eustigma]|eukprot:GAX82196.1 hypothetical protein CEUSTIGMA_g9624.t1 [Chlamydomonas eustigma]
MFTSMDRSVEEDISQRGSKPGTPHQGYQQSVIDFDDESNMKLKQLRAPFGGLSFKIQVSDTEQDGKVLRDLEQLPESPNVAHKASLDRNGTAGVAGDGDMDAQNIPPVTSASAKWGSKKSAGSKPRSSLPTARMLYNKLQFLPRVPQAVLTAQVWSRSLWEVMGGGSIQQRVWTFGNSRQSGGVITAKRIVHTSQKPVPILEGLKITSISAGAYHGAATSQGSYEVFTWGSSKCPDKSVLSAEQRESSSDLHPWLPASCEPIMEMPVEEVVVMPKQMSIKELLRRIPPALRQGLRETDPEGELEEQDVFSRTEADIPVWRVRLPLPVRLVACGAEHTLVSLLHGGVMGWGSNLCGQVGVPLDPLQPIVKGPTVLPELSSCIITDLSAGGNHSLALSGDGDVWAWGDDSYGQLGSGTPSTSARLPLLLRVLKDLNVLKIAAGYRHSLALSLTGEVYGWGDNKVGQLGVALQSFEDSSPSAPLQNCFAIPVLVQGLPPCALISASEISAAVSVSGRLYIWGYDIYLNPQSLPTNPSFRRQTMQSDPDRLWHERGRPEGSHQCRIQEVAWLRPKKVQSIALGFSHALVVTSDQSVYSWGNMLQAMGHPLLTKSQALQITDKALTEAAFAEDNIMNKDYKSPDSARLAVLQNIGYLGASPEQIHRQDSGSVIQLVLDAPESSASGFEAWTPLQYLRYTRELTELQEPQLSVYRQKQSVCARLHIFNGMVKLTIFDNTANQNPMTANQGSGNSSHARVPAYQQPRRVTGRKGDPVVLTVDLEGICDNENIPLGGVSSPASSAPVTPKLPALYFLPPSEEGASKEKYLPHHERPLRGTDLLAADSAQPLILRQEPLCLIAAGNCHSICLCSTTTYLAPPSVLHHLCVLLLSQIAWQHYYDESRRSESAGGPPTRPSTGTRGGVPVYSQAAIQQQIPRNLLHLPGQKGTTHTVEDEHIPWKDALIGQELCVILCRQAGLVDNQVEYMDILAAYSRHSSEKRKNMPPSMLVTGQGIGVSSLNEADIRSSVGVWTQKQQQNDENGRALSPRRLRVVDTVRLQQLQTEELEMRAEQAAKQRQSRDGLNGSEFLSLMLELMAERSADHQASPETLLRRLCGQHMPLLQRRASAGVPWVLGKVLQPQLLHQLDSGPMSEMMHRAFVYMSSSKCVSDDLNLSLKDMKVGLRVSPKAKAASERPSYAVNPEPAGKKPETAGQSSRRGRPGTKGSVSSSAWEAPVKPSTASKEAAALSAAAAAGKAALEASMLSKPVFSVPLLRLVQFLRQAGLLPRVVPRLVTDLYDMGTEALRKVPNSEMVPWWWTRDRSVKPIAHIMFGYGAFRYCPETIEFLQLPVLMAILNEYDVQGIPLPRSKKMYDLSLDPEMLPIIEQRRKDRLLCYVFADLLGDYLVPATHPDDQRPAHVLSMPISYPQFVEVVGSCLIMRAATQSDIGLLKEIRTVWPPSSIRYGLSSLMDGMMLWRDRVINPWKFQRIYRTDSELDSRVDRVFSFFSTINPIENSVTLNAYNFQRLMEACDILDDIVTADRANMTFYVCGKLRTDRIYDFASSSKELEKKEQANRLANLQRQRRELAALQAAAASGDPVALQQIQKPQKFLYQWELDKLKEEEEERERRKQMKRRRKAMGAGLRAISKSNEEDDVDSDEEAASLPEGWPQPISSEVHLLTSMDMPSLQIPRHRAGDPSYYQQLALDLDIAELPDDGGWSGLARPQMGRLHNSPLALSVARQELLGGLMASGPHPLGLANQDNISLPLPVVTNASTPTLSPQPSRSASPTKLPAALGPSGPPRHALAAVAASRPDLVPPTESVLTSTQYTNALLASLDDPILARTFMPPSKGAKKTKSSKRSSPGRLGRPGSSSSQGAGRRRPGSSSKLDPLPEDTGSAQRPSSRLSTRPPGSSGGQQYPDSRPGTGGSMMLLGNVSRGSLGIGIAPVNNTGQLLGIGIFTKPGSPGDSTSGGASAQDAQPLIIPPQQMNASILEGAESGEESDTSSSAPHLKKGGVVVADSINRLTTTRFTLEEGMDMRAPDPNELFMTRLDRKQFGEVVRRLAVAKYAKISSPIAAWRILVERHILPVAESRGTRFDKYLTDLMGPGVVATVLLWEPHLKHLFTTCARLAAEAAARVEAEQAASREAAAVAAEAAAAATAAALAPHRRGPSSGSPVSSPLGSRPSTRGSSRLAITGRIGARLPTLAPAISFTDYSLDSISLITFLQLLQDRRILPQMLPPADVEDIFRRVYLLTDGFQAAGKDDDEVKAVSYLSSRDYCSVLIQELVLPPDVCPEEVMSIIETASYYHNNGQYDKALDMYYQAEKCWENKFKETCDASLTAVVNFNLYFHIISGSVMLSAGRYEAALQEYDDAEAEAESLPSGHPNKAVLHSCRAFALNALHRFDLAFEELVKALVLRSQAITLGPDHVDSQLVCHNLGCVLDRLGRTHKAIELLEKSHRVFQQSLGFQHPRTQTACRNLRHVQHKTTHLDMHYSILPDKNKVSMRGEGGKQSGSRSKDPGVTIGRSNNALNGSKRPGSPSKRVAEDSQKVPGASTGATILSPQQRLEAFRLRRKGAPGQAGSAARGPANLMYIGGGMTAADSETLRLYELMRDDISAHASGRTTRNLPIDVVVVEQPVARGLVRDEKFDSIHVAVRGGVADLTLTARRQKKRIGGGLILPHKMLGRRDDEDDENNKKRPPLDGSKKLVPMFTDRMAVLLKGIAQAHQQQATEKSVSK